MAVRVPNTETFSLQDIYDAVKDHNVNTIGEFQDCVNKAESSYFDVNFNNNTYAPANSFLRFRNYGPSGIACGTETEYVGGESYPTITEVTLGSNTGNVRLGWTVYNLPDLILVIYNNVIVINTGYNGDIAYDYGGASRTTFKNSLIGKVDPVTGGTYPNFTAYPDDGYPRVGPYAYNQILSFQKTLSIPTATVKVYAPLGSTQWKFTLYCPE